MNFSFINTEINEIKNIIINTIKDYIEKYGNSYWRKLEYINKVQLLDKIKKKTKNITNKQGVKRTILSSNGR